MPLYLASHFVATPTAKVPLSMVMLQDFARRQALPPNMHLRLMIPTSGHVSVSLWDAPSAEDLIQWLNENLQYDAEHQVAEAAEDFSLGLSLELARSRAADKVAAGSRNAMERVSQAKARASDSLTKQLEIIDQRTGILTAGENAYLRMKAAASNVASRAAGQGQGAGEASYEQHPSSDTGAPRAAPLSEGLSQTSAAMAASIRHKAGTTFAWLGSTLKQGLSSMSAPKGAVQSEHSDFMQGAMTGEQHSEHMATEADLLLVSELESLEQPAAAPTAHRPEPVHAVGMPVHSPIPHDPAPHPPAQQPPTFTLDDDDEHVAAAGHAAVLPASQPSK